MYNAMLIQRNWEFIDIDGKPIDPKADKLLLSFQDKIFCAESWSKICVMSAKRKKDLELLIWDKALELNLGDSWCVTFFK